MSRHPLSLQQRGYVAAGGLAPWNAVAVFDQQTPIDALTLELLFTRLSDLNEVLRMRFDSADEPAWALLDDACAPLVRSRRVPDRDAALAEVEADKATPFDRTAAPLWRVTTYAYPQPGGPERQLISVVADHLICDGYSLALLEPALTSHAEASQPWGSYVEWLTWQREHFSTPDTPEAHFWRDHLGGTSPFRPVQLPACDPDGAYDRDGQIRVATAVLAARAETVQRTISTLRITAFVALFASVVACLSRLTGGNDFTIHVSTLGRRLADLRTLGWFASLVPIRIAGSSLSDPVAAAAEVKQRWYESLPYQIAPWEYILEQTDPAAASEPPPCNVTINLHPRPNDFARPAENPFESSGSQAGIWLDLLPLPGEGFEVYCSYSPARFTDDGVRTVLDGIAATWRELLGSAGSI